VIIITAAECRQWIHDYRPDVSQQQATKDQITLAYAVPKDSGVKTCLAHSVVAEMSFAQAGLLWITGWGIFPSAENRDLFEGYRKSLGEQRPLHVAPGHVFNDCDRSSVEALLVLCFYFYWDVSLVEGDAGMIIKASHDEWVEVASADLSRRQRIEARFDKLGLKRLQGGN